MNNLDRAKDLLSTFAQNLTNKGIPSTANEGYVALVNKIPLLTTTQGKPHQQRFIDIDGSVYFIQNYATGENGVYPPTNPKKEGLEFVGYTHTLEELANCQYRQTERSVLRMPGDIDVGIQWKTQNSASIFEFEFVGNSGGICELLFSRTPENIPVTLLIKRDNEQTTTSVTLPPYPRTMAIVGQWSSGVTHKLTITSANDVPYQLGDGVNFILTGEQFLTRAYLAEIAQPTAHNFADCSSLRELLIPHGVDGIPVNFCSNTALKSVVVPSGATVIGQSAFSYNPDLKFVALPNSITTLENGCFYSNRGDFEGVSVTGLNFCCRNIDKLVLPKGVNTIPTFAFAHSGIRDLISDPIVSVGDFAFNQATNLRYINLANVVEAGSYSFIGNCAVEQIDNLFLNWESAVSGTDSNAVIGISNWGITRLNPIETVGNVKLNLSILGTRCSHLILGAEINEISENIRIANRSIEVYIFEYSGVITMSVADIVQLFGRNFNHSKAKIYVPDGQVLNYQEDENWQAYTSYIHPISSLPVEMKQYLFEMTKNTVYNV